MKSIINQKWGNPETHNPDITVLRSSAGYYLGTLTEDGAPNTRDSQEYYLSEIVAQAALDRGFFHQRTNP
jgi:hypothetical protein